MVSLPKTSGLEETKYIHKEAIAECFCLGQIVQFQGGDSLASELPFTGVSWKLSQRALEAKYKRLSKNVYWLVEIRLFFCCSVGRS